MDNEMKHGLDNNSAEELIRRNKETKIWDEQPVYCFTSDIDWASEDVMREYFSKVNDLDIRPTLFVTHASEEIRRNYEKGNVERGLHPNFMNGSSHGSSFKEVAETCIQYAPEAYGFRSHRAFDLTDITHLMHNDYGFKYVSHQITILQPAIRPIAHESGLVNYPVFFEDGTHLYNKLELGISAYRDLFDAPGIKIISFHPMNFVFNSPSIAFMRGIKDSLTREQYNAITHDLIKKYWNTKAGIRDTVLEIINHVKKCAYPIYTMNDLYALYMEVERETTGNRTLVTQAG